MCREATHADPKALCFEMCQQLSSADVFVPRLSSSFTCSHEVYEVYEVSFAVVVMTATGDLQALVAWSY